MSTHEWDERTQSYRQRWVVPEHFTSCAKHWPATTGAPPPGTIADRGHEGGQLTTPAARVDAAILREHSTTTHGVPDDCTCVPDHTREILTKSTRVVHSAGCDTRHEPRARDWR